MRTRRYWQKVVVRALFGRTGFDRIRLWKTIVGYKLGVQYELPSPMLESLVRPGDVVLDVGANLGQYACRFSKIVGDEGRVFSLEPVSENFKLLERLIAILGLTNVTALNCAASDRDGEADILIPTVRSTRVEVGTQATLDSASEWSDDVAVRTERVRTTTVDSLALEYGLEHLEILKCDSEGHDAMVVRGAMQSIERYRPILMLEATPEDAGLEQLFALGYRAFYPMDGRLLAWPTESSTEEPLPNCDVYVFAAQGDARLSSLLR